MPLHNVKHEFFAQGIVAGKKPTQAYRDAGYGGTAKAAHVSAHRLQEHPQVKARIAELRAAIGAKLEKAVIRDLNARVRRYEDRLSCLDQIVAERAADPEHHKAPGGKTGYMVRTIKVVGSGEKAFVVEEFAVDTGLLRELRELEKQTAEELGQFEQRHKHEHSGPDGGPIKITDERLKTLTDEELSGLAITLRKLADTDGSGSGDRVPAPK